ncbi:hypothetical protein [Salisediminibacterium beveridgei]|uniref:Uncharacterized protein n=1 Tax=Salisediminibacterium beveridgei TaxID=632773 RepID=A0A1D7QS82_9BACI|nr:hypothetical protein [Salisediminibacterium beveridgei]AOM81874.1 hypothetical protein BBEV_0481 [Salisediminibacterium beveridgei]
MKVISEITLTIGSAAVVGSAFRSTAVTDEYGFYDTDGNGEEEYAGLDWGRNTLLIQKHDGNWFLIMIVNDEM